MPEPIMDEEPLTTSDIAGRSGDYVGESEAEIQNPRRPQLVQNDTANLDLREETANNAVGVRREGNTTLPAATNQNRIDAASPLFSEGEITEFRSHWGTVQTEFVDDPRRAVQEADQLVANVMQRLADGFSKERASLEKQWDSGDNVSTEDLRVALQRYRAFFGRLLSAA
jgi:hypothetical protein